MSFILCIQGDFPVAKTMYAVVMSVNNYIKSYSALNVKLPPQLVVSEWPVPIFLYMYN